MKTLSQRLDEYLALRRSMGFDLSFEERVLRKFTTYAGENGFNRISTPLFLDWKANYGSLKEHEEQVVRALWARCLSENLWTNSERPSS